MSPALTAGAGALIAAGLFALAWAARRPSLADLLAEPRPRPGTGVGGPVVAGWARYGTWGAPVLSALGLPTARVRRALAAAERDTGAYLAEKTLAGVAGAGVVLVLGGTVAATAAPLHPLVGAGAAAVCALACWLAPDLSAASAAAERRAEMDAATSVLADLVVIALAGGAGITGALSRAAAQGHGAAFSRLRLAVHTAALSRTPAWEALADLAERTSSVALGELAASIQLAGTDGARIRASLAAKASSLRARESAEAEARGQAATERMTMPVMVLVVGFLVLIGFPALVHITSGF
ncbi:type II secretion system (T2SS) protein F [Murinocardiopsis flavida]|uniref:Type II secretion system (T2SS) protein F n=1 Tax=Murinocardiopsis flavida TaxID=645275 RepID=A0A2P8DG34_9ACTN|nr:type II secretion system F family protein [Murinocardiopsis flavida]PSK96166.1 type II secretion system (T2SS) protein F [Murinocardiopsis flavida]